MFLPDVNVLVYAHREESPNHLAYLRWLENLISGTQVYGSADLILSGFLRIVTHPLSSIRPVLMSMPWHLWRKSAGRPTA